MALLNVSLNFLSYLDGPKSANPRVRTFDTSFSMLGLPTDITKQEAINLNPGETKTILSTLRALSYTALTSFTITKTNSLVRLAGSFGQRTSRSYGDATTQWTVAVNNDLVTLTYTGTGTAPTFGTFQAGDYATLDTPFSTLNRGDFQIVKVGAAYIQFVNPIAAGEAVTGLVQVYSSGAVQKNDIIDIQSTQFAFPNRGQFKVSRVTDTFVEFSNTNAVPEAGIVGVAANDLAVYPDEYKWVLMAVDKKIVVRLNGATGNSVEVEPPVDDDLTNQPGLYMKRGRVTQIDIYNPGQNVVTGFVFLAK